MKAGRRSRRSRCSATSDAGRRSGKLSSQSPCGRIESVASCSSDGGVARHGRLSVAPQPIAVAVPGAGVAVDRAMAGAAVGAASRTTATSSGTGPVLEVGVGTIWRGRRGAGRRRREQVGLAGDDLRDAAPVRPVSTTQCAAVSTAYGRDHGRRRRTGRRCRSEAPRTTSAAMNGYAPGAVGSRPRCAAGVPAWARGASTNASAARRGISRRRTGNRAPRYDRLQEN